MKVSVGFADCTSQALMQAAELPKGSIKRLLRVAAFALSPYSGCHADRTCKPLYSLPGETLEAVYPSKGVRYIGEAVCIAPPSKDPLINSGKLYITVLLQIQSNGWIIAGHMEGRRWKIATDDQSKPRIWATSMVSLGLPCQCICNPPTQKSKVVMTSISVAGLPSVLVQ